MQPLIHIYRPLDRALFIHTRILSRNDPVMTKYHQIKQIVLTESCERLQSSLAPFANSAPSTHPNRPLSQQNDGPVLVLLVPGDWGACMYSLTRSSDCRYVIDSTLPIDKLCLFHVDLGQVLSSGHLLVRRLSGNGQRCARGL